MYMYFSLLLVYSANKRSRNLLPTATVLVFSLPIVTVMRLKLALLFSWHITVMRDAKFQPY